MSTSAVFLHVAVPVKLYTLLDYLMPKEINPNQIQPGQRVVVPFRGKEKIGIIMGIEASSTLAIDKVKPILRVIDDDVLLPAQCLSLIQWASDYYQYPIGLCFQIALPKYWLTKKVLPDLAIRNWVLNPNKDITVHPRAKQQQRIIDFIKLKGQCSRTDLTTYEFSQSAFNALLQSNLLVAQRNRKAQKFQLKTQALALNHEQQICLDQFSTQSNLEPILLEGVTGSGKTEVFLQMTQKVIQQGHQVLILVPEIGLTPQTLKRFTDRFNCSVGLLHSNMTNKQRFEQWLKTLKGIDQIIIGTRSAIFTPFKSLGLIVVDEEHDLSYKQQDSLRYSARDLAIVKAKQHKIPLMLSSATPALESKHNANIGRYRHFTLTQRAGAASMPTIVIEDIRNKAMTAGLTQTTLESIHYHLQQHEQVLIFLNRRGFAAATICHHCGWSLTCNACDTNMTYYHGKQQSHCHQCGNVQSPPVCCPQCGSQHIEQNGVGTERIASALASLFPSTPLFQIDRDTTTNQQQMERTLANIASSNEAILIGTQMLAKGHHFPKVTLVVIVNTDSALMSADFRAKERFGQLLTQVIGRAGRGDIAGKAIIQTHYPQHEQLLQLIKNGYIIFSQTLLQERQQLHLPPFSFMALITLEAQQPQEAIDLLAALANKIRIQSLLLIGPFPAAIAKRAHYFRFQLILRSPERKLLRKSTLLARTIGHQLIAARHRFSIDIDPQDMA